MVLVDTHSHIYLNEFDNDREQVIKNAFTNNVSKILFPNIDSSTVAPLLKLAGDYPNNFFPMMGLHPTSVKNDYLEELKNVELWLKKEKFYAIGEIGIDLYWDKTFKIQQIDAFEKQIELAINNDLPIVIHTRSSFELIFDIIGKYKIDKLRGVFHCFTGNNEQAEKIISLGFKLGIGGIVTFKNSGLDKVVQNVDLENILLETDSPYLSPAPKRGKRNESANIIYIAEKIARLHNVTIDKLAEITTQNAKELFNITIL
ncbi:MAG: TatD family hydrolase [Bacteroidetes bacterium]|nr:TatD family hydrolase [Bacteroidota bacterium]